MHKLVQQEKRGDKLELSTLEVTLILLKSFVMHEGGRKWEVIFEGDGVDTGISSKDRRNHSILYANENELEGEPDKVSDKECLEPVEMVPSEHRERMT